MDSNYIAIDYKDNHGQVYVVDIDNKRVALVDRNKLSTLPVDYTLGKIAGTLAFTDKSGKYVGVFQVFSGKLYLTWLRKSSFDIDRRKNDVYASKNIISLGDINEIVKQEEWAKGIKQLYSKNLSKRTIRVSILLNDSVFEETVKAEEETVKTEEETVKAEEETVKAEEETVKAEEETVIGVNKIYSFSGETEILNNPSDCMYEMLLKMVKVNDSVSISKDFISKIKVYMKKSLEASLDYSKYKALVVIKIEEHSDFSILAVLDYDENKEDVRVSILKPYNKSVASEHDINTYYTEYIKWRKANNMR